MNANDKFTLREYFNGGETQCFQAGFSNDSKKQQIMADLERLTAEADQLPEGDQRQQLVAQIAKLNVEYQAED